jgi:hypothetical protein
MDDQMFGGEMDEDDDEEEEDEVSDEDADIFSKI